MTPLRLVSVVSLAALAVCLAATSAPAAPRAEAFVLTSPAFATGKPIPAKYTCRGAGARPTLKWKGTPKGTKALAVLVDDPDAAQLSFIKPDEVLGDPFVYWLGWGIEAAATSIAGPAPLEGKNDADKRGWTAICPQEGGVHSIRFRLYALSAPITLKAGSRVDAFQKAIAGKVLGTAKLIGKASN
jgi:Raf kinase inhibitor-like YbhB/YbcL family protein